MSATRAAWNGIQHSLEPCEQSRIIKEQERTGKSFDSIVLRYLRKGMEAGPEPARYCRQCGGRGQ